MEQLPTLSEADRVALLKTDKANREMPKPPYQVLEDGSREANDWLAEWQEANTVISAPDQESEA